MIITKFKSKTILISLIVGCLAFLQINLSYAGTVVVKPGQFDHFTLQMPDKIIAGENSLIKVEVYDSNNNLITDFSESGKQFRIDINGSAAIQPSTLSAVSFSGGIANISISSKKAEKIIFSIRESGGTFPLISKELKVLPNKLNHFILQSRGTATAGNGFDVRVIAKDLFNNTVDDLNIGRNIKFTSTGTSSIKMIGNSAADFRNGVAMVSFISEKAGDVIIELQEISTGSRGQTQKITINPSFLSYFKMQSPKKAVAGEDFELLVAAYDSYGNIITNYSSIGSGVKLYTTGSSKIEPSFLDPSEFKNGQAAIKTVYEKAEEIQIIAKESNREESGKTAEILISNAAPEHFYVVTPDTAVSGQKFKIKVEAYDRFNNLVKNYNLIGNNIILNTSGTGTISPSKISPSEFLNGITMVDVTYDRAESFLLSAKMMGDIRQGSVSLKNHYTKKEEVPHTKLVQKTAKRAPQKPTAVPKSKPLKTEPNKDIKSKLNKLLERIVSKKAVSKKAVSKKAVSKKAVSKKAVSKKAVSKKAVSKKAVSKKAVSKKAVSKKAVSKKAVSKKAVSKKIVSKKAMKEITRNGTIEKSIKTVQKKPTLKVVTAKPKKKEIKPEKKAPEESKKIVFETAKKANTKVKKLPNIFRVSNISIIEAKNRAMLIINITNPNGRLEYTDSIVSKYGKEWLKIKIKPAINTTEKSFEFKSAFVREVFFEKDKESRNVLDIYVELLAPKIAFDIARVKNTLIVTLARP